MAGLVKLQRGITAIDGRPLRAYSVEKLASSPEGSR
jgi:hypothetical protein